jgi:hypothetical protein
VFAVERALSNLNVIRGGGVPPSSVLPVRMRLACGDCLVGTGDGSRDGGLGNASSFDFTLVMRL